MALTTEQRIKILEVIVFELWQVNSTKFSDEAWKTMAPLVKLLTEELERNASNN